MQLYNRVTNHSVLGGDARDTVKEKANNDDSPTSNELTNSSSPQGAVFAGMSAAQRYELDTFGFLHLHGVLSPTELASARAAFDRTQHDSSLLTPYGELPFAADADLEALASHPKILPVLLELCNEAPHLVSGGTLWTAPFTHAGDLSQHQQQTRGKPQGSGQLHCQREYDRHHASFASEAPGRCRCDNLVVFPYLDTCEAGDGGLLLVPGSHKSQFCRPRTIFQPYGRHEDQWQDKDWGRSSALSQEHSPAWHEVPAGLLNLCPSAGDYIILPEASSHGIMPWRSAEHGRRVLSLRFKSGPSYAMHCATHPPHPPRLLARLARPTRALVESDRCHPFDTG